MRALTLVELLIVAGAVALLIAITVPAVSAARARARQVICASNMGRLAQGLCGYAASNADTLPVNAVLWTEADCGTRWVFVGTGGANWVDLVARHLQPADRAPRLYGLRCPDAAVASEEWMQREHGFKLVAPGEPGACWYFNSYCSGRRLASVPRAADGVLLLEVGVWDGRAVDTGSLEHPSQPWAYPHPAVLVERALAPWHWPGSEPRSRKRNIAWVDGHVATFAARTWPNADQPWDTDRIRHMRFDLPGNYPDHP